MFDDSATERANAALTDARRKDAVEAALSAVQTVRDQALEWAQQLATRYTERRTQLQQTEGDGFIGLVLYVRERNVGKSISLEWQLQHFRYGKPVGSTSLKKRRGSPGYDIALLKRSSPEWAHPLVIETEHEARQIREVLLRLTEADVALAVAQRRFAGINDDDGLSAPSTEDHL